MKLIFLLQVTYLNIRSLGKGEYNFITELRSAGVVIEVNLKERVKCTPPPSVNKAAHSGFETQGRCHRKFKTGVSVAP